MSLLEQTGPVVQREVRILNQTLHGNFRYNNAQDLEDAVNHLRYHIWDLVISMLLKEDADKQTKFITNQ